MNATNCPLCNAANSRLVLELPTAEIYHCLVCNNGWTTPSPEEMDYAVGDFHKQIDSPVLEPTRLDSLPSAWQTSIKAQCKLLESHAKPGAKVLEIGCGEGILLGMLASKGFLTVGIEPSFTGSERARLRGLDVKTGYFPHPEVTGNFDVVIMSHVLEHLPDPASILVRSRDI